MVQAQSFESEAKVKDPIKRLTTKIKATLN